MWGFSGSLDNIACLSLQENVAMFALSLYMYDIRLFLEDSLIYLILEL